MVVWQRYAELSSVWHLVAVACAVVVVAALVNRLSPSRRSSLRRVVTIFLLYALSTFLSLAPGVGDATRWPGVVRALLEAFTLVHLGGIVVFDLLLPRVGVSLAAITVELMFGGAYALTTFAVLTAAGVEVGSVVAASGVVAAVLTISLQSTLGNVVGGVAVQLDGSIHAGDWVRLDSGREGRVRQVGWRRILLETRDGDTIVVPNATLLSTAFTLLGKRQDRLHPHRIWVYFHVDFRHGPAEVCETVRAGLVSTPIPNVVSHPGPEVVCLDLGRDGRESVGVYAARVWLHDVEPDEPTASVVRGRVHAALRRAGIPLARPSLTQFHVPADEESEAARSERRQRRAAATLRALSLFSSLNEAEVVSLASQVLFAPFSRGEVMTSQGNVAHYLYILERGTVEVRLSAGGEEKVVATMSAPDFFGEMGLMTGAARSASVVATSDVVCYRLGKGAFHDVLLKRPEIAAAVSGVLAARRVELESHREHLDAATRTARERGEAERILGTIRGFFGLDGG